MNTLQMILSKKQEILELARRRGAYDVRVFGSVIRGVDTAESDVDFLVALQPGASLLDLGGFQMDLQNLLQRRVDVVTEAGLRDRIRDAVLREAKPI